MNKNEILFCLIHPIQAIRAKERQTAVAIEHSSPPTGSSIEEFPNLPIHVAANILFPPPTSGVPLEAWSQKDQQRLANGELPKGHPEHPNV